MEYRIKELFNRFYPQAKVTQTETVNSGFLGLGKEKFKTTDKWVYMDVYSNAPIRSYLYSHAVGNHQKNMVCSTLNEAKLYIKSLDKGTIYHKIED